MVYLTRAMYYDIGGGMLAKRREDSAPRNIVNDLRIARPPCMGYTLSSMICTGVPLFQPLLSRIRLVYRVKVLFSSFRIASWSLLNEGAMGCDIITCVGEKNNQCPRDIIPLHNLVKRCFRIFRQL